MPATPTKDATGIEAARSFFAAYNAHDVDKMVTECSADAQLRYVPMGSQGQGKVRELGKAIWSSFIDTFPDLHVTVQSIFGDGRNVTAEVMIGGTQQKDLHYGLVRIPSQGKQYESTIRNRARMSAPARVTSRLVCPIDGFQCNMELSRMPYAWPEDTDFALWELDVLDRDCPTCGRMMHVCDHRYRRFHTLEGPVELVCMLNHCPDPACPGHSRTTSPELEVTIALPKWAIGWDVLCWIGHRRCSRHWSIPQIDGELRDDYGIRLSADSIARYIQHYQVMLAARQEDPEAMRRQYQSVGEIILSIDGLQPEKGHETLDVVRELTQKRIWFAEPLISATADEVRRLIAKAREWAESLGKPVALWLSDKQDAFVTGIAAEFPEVTHRSCDNHFLRDVAKPVLEADSHAKVQMRRKVRGLRTIEQAVIKRQKAETRDDLGPDDPEATVTASVEPANLPAPVVDPARAVVLDSCAAVRGILNDDQGGPLHPPSLRMAEALNEVRESLQRDLDEKKGGSRKRNSAAWPDASRAAWTKSRSSKS